MVQAGLQKTAQRDVVLLGLRAVLRTHLPKYVPIPFYWPDRM